MRGLAYHNAKSSLRTIRKGAVYLVYRFNIPSNIRLADPQFHIPSEIDIVIGTEWFWDLMCVGQIKLGGGKPTLQKTIMGWLVVGKILQEAPGRKPQTACNLSSTRMLDETLRQFWKIDDIPKRAEINEEDLECEEFFKGTYTRNAEGRFVVRLPIKQEVIDKMGESKGVAERRFRSLERKLEKNPELKDEYVRFMKDYRELGHMREINEQSDRYVLTADIIKMYRQILIHEDHTPFRTIYWR
ncbi:PREDICTED: uncharacterized protein LOC105556543 [Vollenhovia emeryi]|uniref:uncharacterized protein LOC105556543 n=1 Tax=Vollenhovia emeryi TaxID=411798 RepID=UPI0005F529E8|nr:PREDICTED: uncharacterized protein LOC105556543 [Vollenhovia emeryi]